LTFRPMAMVVLREWAPWCSNKGRGARSRLKAPPSTRMVTDKKAIVEIQMDSEVPHDCDCHLTRWAPYRDVDGHVSTQDLKCIANLELRTMMQHGTNMRVNHHHMDVGPTAMEDRDKETMETALSLYLKRTCETLELSSALFNEWASKVRQAFQDVIESQWKIRKADAYDGEFGNQLTDSAEDAFKVLCRKFTVIQTDKATTTVRIKCKRQMQRRAKTEALDSGVYERTAKSTEAIIDADRVYSDANNLARTADKDGKDPDGLFVPKMQRFSAGIPCMGITEKQHKVGMRVLARGDKVSAAAASRWMTKALKAVSICADREWCKLFSRWGIYVSKSWVTYDHADVRKNMQRLRTSRIRTKTQQCFDFSKMYTTLRHDEIKTRLDKVIGMAFESYEAQGKPVLQVKRYGPGIFMEDGRYKDTPTVQYFTRERLSEMLTHILDTLYIQVGDAVFRQSLGIPMGSSCAPFVANLLLFSYEYEYVKQLSMEVGVSKGRKGIESWKKWKLLQRLSFCLRYIDDLWNPVVPHDTFDTIWPKIYPPFLVLTKESEGNKVNYLDMTIWCDYSTYDWESTLYDKRVQMKSLGLKLNKFPHPDSCMSVKCKYGVITSQCHRFLICCSSPRSYLNAATKLFDEYIAKGYELVTISKYFEKFVRSKSQQLCLRPNAVRDAWRKRRRRMWNEFALGGM
jgi:hypothetical protein